jgi:FkbM family methyltransferase
MSLSEIKNKFLEGKIDKWKFIDEMYDVHSQLFEYSSFIKNTNISGIAIEDDEVVFTFRDSRLKFICSPGDKRLAPFDTINFGSYEQEEFNMQMKLMNDNDVVFDIGANFGWYSLYASINKPAAKIFAFEPVPNTFNYLNRNISKNGIKNITTFNFGFSEEKGHFDLFYDPKLSVNASLANLSEVEGVKKISCEIRKLDDFTAENKSKVNFIKCDVEGAELFVYKGGKETLAKYTPVIFTEMLRKWTSKFSYSPNEIIDFLGGLGYKCFVLNDQDTLKEFDRVDENTKETNYYFLHSVSHGDMIKKFVSHD